MLGTVLLVFAFCFAIFEAFEVPRVFRGQWGWLAVALLILGLILGPIPIQSLLRTY